MSRSEVDEVIQAWAGLLDADALRMLVYMTDHSPNKDDSRPCIWGGSVKQAAKRLYPKDWETEGVRRVWKHIHYLVNAGAVIECRPGRYGDQWQVMLAHTQRR